MRHLTIAGARAAAVLILVAWAGIASAVQPDEILEDAGLEARARNLSQGLRCLVCRNENIDDSNADLARDLRLLVRERLVAGDSDQAVLDFITDRYGEYVLLNPPVTGANWILWGAGPLMLLVAGGVSVGFLRRRSRGNQDQEAGLSASEAERLAEILGDKETRDPG